MLPKASLGDDHSFPALVVKRDALSFTFSVHALLPRRCTVKVPDVCRSAARVDSPGFVGDATVGVVPIALHSVGDSAVGVMPIAFLNDVVFERTPLVFQSTVGFSLSLLEAISGVLFVAIARSSMPCVFVTSSKTGHFHRCYQELTFLLAQPKQHQQQ